MPHHDLVLPDDPTRDRAPAIVELYRAFQACPLPPVLEYCTYCDDEEYEQALHAPVESLPVDLVDKYLADAIHHTGTQDDFPHFVPRIVELEHDVGLDWFWVFADRVESCHFERWPVERRDALLRALERIPRHRQVDADWLVPVARLEGIDLDALLRGWATSADDAGAAWLAGAIERRQLAPDKRNANAAFAAFLATEGGALFAAEHGACAPSN